MNTTTNKQPRPDFREMVAGDRGTQGRAALSLRNELLRLWAAADAESDALPPRCAVALRDLNKAYPRILTVL